MSRDHHGPSAREQAILDRFEADATVEDIARELDLAPRYVKQIVQALGAPKLEDWQSSARFGSDALLRAIRHHHPDRCGGAA